GDVAQHVRVRGRAVHEAERDARIGRVRERALALDEEELCPTPGALPDEALGRAGDEVGDDRIDRYPPARDRDARLPGRHELRLQPARPRLAVELDRDWLLPGRAVGAGGRSG